MKLIIAGVVLAVVMGLVVQHRDSFLIADQALTYVKEGVTTEVVKEVTPDWASDAEAVQAAKDVIRKKELEAAIQALDKEVAEKEKRHSEEMKQKQEERKKLAEELTAYWTPEKVKAAIRKTFWEEPITAVAVAMGESELYAGAYNPENHYDKNGDYVCSGSVGVMQVACVHQLNNIASLHDVEKNLKVARAVYDDSKKRTGNGWKPWGAYTDGRYKAHLAQR